MASILVSMALRFSLQAGEEPTEKCKGAPYGSALRMAATNALVACVPFVIANGIQQMRIKGVSLDYSVTWTMLTGMTMAGIFKLRNSIAQEETDYDLKCVSAILDLGSFWMSGMMVLINNA